MATPRKDDLTNATDRDRNPDAITGAPGSHPIGTGVGAAGGGAAGAAIGAAVTGPAAPVGAVVGAVIGAVAGGLAGKGAAEAVNPTVEDEYWRQNYSTRPYYEKNYNYESDYRPAYQYGWTSRSSYAGRKFEDVENDLRSGWEKTKDKSRLAWDKAKFATRDAWDRAENRGGAGSTTGTVGSPSAYPGTGTGTSSDFGDADYDDFARTSSSRYQGRRFDDIEGDLRRDWETGHRGSSKTWENVKDSVRRAWHKVERAIPGDADRDGR